MVATPISVVSLSIVAILSFVVTWVVMPWMIRALNRVEMTGKDLHKKDSSIHTRVGLEFEMQCGRGDRSELNLLE